MQPAASEGTADSTALSAQTARPPWRASLMPQPNPPPPVSVIHAPPSSPCCLSGPFPEAALFQSASLKCISDSDQGQQSSGGMGQAQQQPWLGNASELVALGRQHPQLGLDSQTSVFSQSSCSAAPPPPGRLLPFASSSQNAASPQCEVFQRSELVCAQRSLCRASSAAKAFAKPALALPLEIESFCKKPRDKTERRREKGATTTASSGASFRGAGAAAGGSSRRPGLFDRQVNCRHALREAAVIQAMREKALQRRRAGLSPALLIDLSSDEEGAAAAATASRKASLDKTPLPSRLPQAPCERRLSIALADKEEAFDGGAAGGVSVVDLADSAPCPSSPSEAFLVHAAAFVAGGEPLSFAGSSLLPNEDFPSLPEVASFAKPSNDALVHQEDLAAGQGAAAAGSEMVLEEEALSPVEKPVSPQGCGEEAASAEQHLVLQIHRAGSAASSVSLDRWTFRGASPAASFQEIRDEASAETGRGAAAGGLCTLAQFSVKDLRQVQCCVLRLKKAALAAADGSDHLFSSRCTDAAGKSPRDTFERKQKRHRPVAAGNPESEQKQKRAEGVFSDSEAAAPNASAFSSEPAATATVTAVLHNSDERGLSSEGDDGRSAEGGRESESLGGAEPRQTRTLLHSHTLKGERQRPSSPGLDASSSPASAPLQPAVSPEKAKEEPRKGADEEAESASSCLEKSEADKSGSSAGVGANRDGERESEVGPHHSSSKFSRAAAGSRSGRTALRVYSCAVWKVKDSIALKRLYRRSLEASPSPERGTDEDRGALRGVAERKAEKGECEPPSEGARKDLDEGTSVAPGAGKCNMEESCLKAVDAKAEDETALTLHLGIPANSSESGTHRGRCQEGLLTATPLCSASASLAESSQTASASKPSAETPPEAEALKPDSQDGGGSSRGTDSFRDSSKRRRSEPEASRLSFSGEESFPSPSPVGGKSAGGECGPGDSFSLRDLNPTTHKGEAPTAGPLVKCLGMAPCSKGLSLSPSGEGAVRDCRRRPSEENPSEALVALARQKAASGGGADLKVFLLCVQVEFKTKAVWPEATSVSRESRLPTLQAQRRQGEGETQDGSGIRCGQSSSPDLSAAIGACLSGASQEEGLRQRSLSEKNAPPNEEACGDLEANKSLPQDAPQVASEEGSGQRLRLAQVSDALALPSPGASSASGGNGQQRLSAEEGGLQLSGDSTATTQRPEGELHERRSLGAEADSSLGLQQPCLVSEDAASEAVIQALQKSSSRSDGNTRKAPLVRVESPNAPAENSQPTTKEHIASLKDKESRPSKPTPVTKPRRSEEGNCKTGWMLLCVGPCLSAPRQSDARSSETPLGEGLAKCSSQMAGASTVSPSEAEFRLNITPESSEPQRESTSDPPPPCSQAEVCAERGVEEQTELQQPQPSLAEAQADGLYDPLKQFALDACAALRRACLQGSKNPPVGPRGSGEIPPTPGEAVLDCAQNALDRRTLNEAEIIQDCDCVGLAKKLQGAADAPVPKMSLEEVGDDSRGTAKDKSDARRETMQRVPAQWIFRFATNACLLSTNALAASAKGGPKVEKLRSAWRREMFLWQKNAFPRLSERISNPVGRLRVPSFDGPLSDSSLRRLNAQEFLDDSIIDFFLQFIVEHVLTPDQRRQVYVSNTFFMSSLLKEKSDAEAHRRLTRWLRKEPVPLPERDLILIPIHHKYQHWSLAVVVCPWRAVHATSQKVRISPALTSGDQVSQNGVVQPSFPLKRSFAESKALPSPSVQHRRKRLNCDRSSVFSPGVGALSQIRPARRVDCRQRRPAGPHALTPPQQKAALFHVDSMGLRSIFDRNRSRLKQFIKREFESRCRGSKYSSDSDLCTEPCCWSDAVSCSLHTPRQQNGYDCGVFVIEYALFLVRNLDLAEALLHGPKPFKSAEAESSLPHSLWSRTSPAGTHDGSAVPLLTTLSPGADARAETRGTKHQRVPFGFWCSCMATERTSAESTQDGNLSGEQRTPESQRDKAELRGLDPRAENTAATQVLAAASYARPSAAVEQVSLQQALLERGSDTQREGAKTPTASPGCGEGGANSPGRGNQPLSANESFVSSGSLPFLSESVRQGDRGKRRTAHAKWFTQVAVTRRRRQMLTMLQFMRKNPKWRENPKQIMFLKSLLLDSPPSSEMIALP